MKKIHHGDTIIIEKGMKLITKIPEKFVDPNTPFSSLETSTTITVGEILEQKPFSKEDYFDMFKFRTMDFFKLEDSKIKEFINLNPNLLVRETYDTSYLEGEYTVTNIGLTLQNLMYVCAEKFYDGRLVCILLYLSKDYYPLVEDIKVFN